MDNLPILIFVAFVTFVLGAFVGVFFTRYLFKKQMKDWQTKMETPDKDQVRNVLGALGKKPSEEQVNRFVNMVKKQQENKKSAKVSKTSKKKSKKV